MKKEFEISDIKLKSRGKNPEYNRMRRYIDRWEILPPEIAESFKLLINVIQGMCRKSMTYDDLKYRFEELLRKCCGKPVSYISLQDVTDVSAEILCHIQVTIYIRDYSTFYKEKIDKRDIKDMQESLDRYRSNILGIDSKDTLNEYIEGLMYI